MVARSSWAVVFTSMTFTRLLVVCNCITNVLTRWRRAVHRPTLPTGVVNDFLRKKCNQHGTKGESEKNDHRPLLVGELPILGPLVWNYSAGRGHRLDRLGRGGERHARAERSCQVGRAISAQSDCTHAHLVFTLTP